MLLIILPNIFIMNKSRIGQKYIIHHSVSAACTSQPSGEVSKHAFLFLFFIVPADPTFFRTLFSSSEDRINFLQMMSIHFCKIRSLSLTPIGL